MSCKKCGAATEGDAKFCPQCGESLANQVEEALCEDCGARLKPGAKFCQVCGKEQAQIDRETALGATWGDIKPEKRAKRSGRDMKYVIMPMLFVPFVAGIFYLLSFGDQNPETHQHETPPEQSEQGMAQMQQVFETIDSLRTRLAENPTDTTALLVMGEMYEIAGKFSQAREYYDRYLKVDPARVDVRMRLASAYFSEKNYFAAQENLEKILEAEPGNAHAIYNYAFTQHMLGDNEGALENWQRAADLDPEGEIGKHARSALESMKSQTN